MRLFFSTVLFFHHRPHLAGHCLAEHGMFLSRQVHIVGLIGQSYDCCTVKKFRARSTHCFSITGPHALVLGNAPAKKSPYGV